MFLPSSGSLDSPSSPKKKGSFVDHAKENVGVLLDSPSSKGLKSSGSKLGLESLNINVLNARFEENIQSKGNGFDKENLSSRSMTKLKSRPSASSFTKTSQEPKFGWNSTTDVIEDEAQEFNIPDFVSSVPLPRPDFLGLPPLPSFLTPTPPLSLPPLTPPCSPYLPPNYPIYVPSASIPLGLFSPSVSSLSAPPPFVGVTATVEQDGFIRLKLNFEVVLEMKTNMAMRLRNPNRDTSITLAASTKHAAIIHPKGRVLVYEPRVEVQTEDDLNVKNAKVYPRGISFTANNMALVYLLDEAGARSTSDMFHDLYATNIVDTLFTESRSEEESEEAVQESIKTLDEAQYWRTQAGVDCWVFKDVFIQQTMDGLVIVERKLEDGRAATIKVSPSNGKVRLNSDFVQVKVVSNIFQPYYLSSPSPVTKSEIQNSKSTGKGLGLGLTI